MESKKLLICHSPGLMGKDIIFNLIPFFNLLPNSEVTQIGDGRENGCVRTDFLTSKHKYVGSIIIDGLEFFAFEIPNHILFEIENLDMTYNYYLLYEKTEHEIFRYRYFGKKSRCYVRWIKPIFK